jgi:hypothetical protein
MIFHKPGDPWVSEPPQGAELRSSHASSASKPDKVPANSIREPPGFSHAK